jgi:tRNA (mo5U34)-methyltransferase
MSGTQASLSLAQLQQAALAIPHWFHSIDLGQGVVTPGDKTVEQLERELRALCLPDLRGQSVLDIGAWDGFFSWAVERLGAARVVALDHFVWATDLQLAGQLAQDWHTLGSPPKLFETTEAWKPVELPGKRGYDLAHRVLKSRVETCVGNFMDMDCAALGGPFDVVLWLGVLYHMRHPLLAMEKVAAATKRLAIIETEALEIAGLGQHAWMEFFERDELAHDFTNWWAPNEKALVGLCRAAGFRRVDVIQGAPTLAAETGSVWRRLRHSGRQAISKLGRLENPVPIKRYRAILHAWK